MGHLTKDDSKFLDMTVKAADNPKSEEAQKVRVALQAFVNRPRKELKKKIQAAGVSTDFPLMTTGSFNTITEEDNFDLGWELAFLTVPRDADKDFWEIGTIENGITFSKVEEGARIQVDKISGERQLVYVDYYGGALGFTDKMIRFRKLAQMFNKARGFRNKFWTNKANNFYAILAAAAAGNVIPYQGVAANARVQRDALTINEGAFQIGNANKDKGYGDTARSALVIYANPQDEERIEAAFRVTTNYLAAGAQNGTSITNRPIRRVYTYNSNINAGAPLLILPGNKIQRNDAMAPTTYVVPKDPLTLNEVYAVWAIYGGAVGDTDQCYQLTLG